VRRNDPLSGYAEQRDRVKRKRALRARNPPRDSPVGLIRADEQRGRMPSSSRAASSSPTLSPKRRRENIGRLDPSCLENAPVLPRRGEPGNSAGLLGRYWDGILELPIQRGYPIPTGADCLRPHNLSPLRNRENRLLKIVRNSISTIVRQLHCIHGVREQSLLTLCSVRSPTSNWDDSPSKVRAGTATSPGSRPQQRHRYHDRSRY
jgi:hypothetical protein